MLDEKDFDDWAPTYDESVERADAAGAYPFAGYERVMDPIVERVTALLDHAYIDMKHWDAAAHREGTGVENDLILANTRRAIERGLDVLVRTPVILGFNDSTEDARRFAERLHEVGASRVQLLPFHNFGESKYDLLGRDYRLHGKVTLHPEDLEEFRQAYVDAGIDAFF